MTVQRTIENKLTAQLDLLYLDVINESSNHNVPAGSESHFKVILVTERFAGQGLLARHRCINEILANELEKSIHALSIHAYTPQEWAEHQQQAPLSPPCRGGET